MLFVLAPRFFSSSHPFSLPRSVARIRPIRLPIRLLLVQIFATGILALYRLSTDVSALQLFDRHLISPLVSQKTLDLPLYIFLLSISLSISVVKAPKIRECGFCG